jgi:hypothetical protein
MGRRVGCKRQCLLLYLRKMRKFSELVFFVKNYLENRSRFSRQYLLKRPNIFGHIFCPFYIFPFQYQFYGWLVKIFILFAISILTNDRLGDFGFHVCDLLPFSFVVTVIFFHIFYRHSFNLIRTLLYTSPSQFAEVRLWVQL